MNAKLIQPHTVPANCISSTAPGISPDPKPLTVGKVYSVNSWHRNAAGEIDRLELFIGRRWYDVPANKFELTGGNNA